MSTSPPDSIAEQLSSRTTELKEEFNYARDSLVDALPDAELRTLVNLCSDTIARAGGMQDKREKLEALGDAAYIEQQARLARNGKLPGLPGTADSAGIARAEAKANITALRVYDSHAEIIERLLDESSQALADRLPPETAESGAPHREDEPRSAEDEMRTFLSRRVERAIADLRIEVHALLPRSFWTAFSDATPEQQAFWYDYVEFAKYHADRRHRSLGRPDTQRRLEAYWSVHNQPAIEQQIWEAEGVTAALVKLEDRGRVAGHTPRQIEAERTRFRDHIDRMHGERFPFQRESYFTNRVS